MKRLMFVVCRLGATAGLLAVGAGCPSEDKTPPPKACCDQPKIPAGVAAFKIIADDVTGPSDGQTVKIRAALAKPVPRDQIYPVLHTIYRFAMTRGPFEPITFNAALYTSDADAQVAGKPIAEIARAQSEIAPKCENAVPYSFEETVARAFEASRGRADEESVDDTCRMMEKKKVARVDDGFKHQPTFTVDPAKRAVAITYPYLESGKDAYAADLKFNTAMTYWIEFVTSMFRKAPDLQEVSFTGVHDDAPVVRIVTSRADFNGQLTNLQEEIAAHSGVTFASLGMHKTDDKGALKEQETFKAKTYKAALAQLPKSQVTVSPKLK